MSRNAKLWIFDAGTTLFWIGLVCLILWHAYGCRTSGPYVSIRDSPGAAVGIQGCRTVSDQPKTTPITTDVGRGAKVSGLPQ